VNPMETRINEVVDSLRGAALRQDGGGLTDGQLLAQFIERREQAAVAALVRRHGPMVWGVCRRILRSHHDAEDAFQATFLVLVRKAVSIRQRETMANWLYGVAHQTAVKARAMLAKRRTRETQGTTMPEPQAPDQVARNDLQPLLDQELSRLPDKYRVAIVLCDLEGKTRREAARQLGLPEGTLAGRLTRGRTMLARRLARHGLAVSGGALAALFSQEAASAGLPISVAASTIKAASLFAAGQAAAAAAISVHVAALTEGVLNAMLLAKLRVPLTLVFALALALAGTGLAYRLVHTPAAGAQPPSQRDQSAPGGQAAASPKPAAEKTTAARGQEFLNDALKEFEAAADEAPGDSVLRHRLLADMAGVQAQLGDRDAAKTLFAQASDMVATLRESDQAMEWQWLAGSAARAGEVDEAIAAALRIPKGKQDRDYAFRQVATALARKRLEKEALRVVAMVEDEEMKPWVGADLLEELALANAAAGNIPEALRIVERMKDPSSQVTALLGRFNLHMSYDYPVDKGAQGVALLQAKAGDKAVAGKTLRRAADLIAAMPEDTTAPRARALALTRLACAQARLGELAAARKTAEKIRNENGKAVALATLVRQLAQAGRVKEAVAEIDPLPVGTAKIHALTHLGAGQAGAGDQKAARASFEQAHLLIEKLPGEEDRMSQGVILGTVRAEAGDYKGAIQTAEAYNLESTLVYANIAYAHAKAGDITGALEVAERLKGRVVRLRPGGQARPVPDWWKLKILQATAELQAQRGESKAAREWIDRLDLHLARAWALTGMAEGMLKATPPRGKK
jgi:RNA polymerase sigma factor (sigma-70 family)